MVNQLKNSAHTIKNIVNYSTQVLLNILFQYCEKSVVIYLIYFRREGKGGREGRKEGRKEGRADGRTDGRKEGRKEGKKEREEGWTDRQMEKGKE